MNRILSIFFALTVLAPTLLKVCVLGNYWVQFEKYAYELCVNQDKQEMSCNGKCQLMKEMNQADKEIPFAATNSLSFKELPAISNSANELLGYYATTEKLIYKFSTPVLILGVNSDVFHPPCTA